MSALARVLATIDALSRACGYVAAMLVLGIAALILAEIFCRTALNVSLSFAWEYAAYFFAVSIFLAAAFALRSGGYVRVMLLSQSVSRRRRYSSRSQRVAWAGSCVGSNSKSSSSTSSGAAHMM